MSYGEKARSIEGEVTPGLVLGQNVAAVTGHDVEKCVAASCFCLCDGQGKCVAVLHVREGRACVGVPDKDGGHVHAFVDELLAKLREGNVT